MSIVEHELDGEEEEGADDDEHGADRERDVEVDVELLVDRQRERLRDALERAGEHDRRAELADPARERERPAGAEPTGCQRQGDAEERSSGAGAERAGGAGEGRVDRLERRDRGAEVERAGDEHDREDDGELGERRVESPSDVQRPAEQAVATESREQSDPGDRRRQHERQLDRASRAATWPRTERDPIRYAAGVPISRISAIRDQCRLQRHDERVDRGRVVRARRAAVRAGCRGRSRRSAGGGTRA